MPILATLFGIISFVPLITAFFARSQGRPFWKWYAVGCVLPLVSVFILFFLDEKKAE